MKQFSVAVNKIEDGILHVRLQSYSLLPRIRLKTAFCMSVQQD